MRWTNRKGRAGRAGSWLKRPRRGKYPGNLLILGVSLGSAAAGIRVLTQRRGRKGGPDVSFMASRRGSNRSFTESLLDKSGFGHRGGLDTGILEDVRNIWMSIGLEFGYYENLGT